MKKNQKAIVKAVQSPALDRLSGFVYRSGSDVLARFRENGWTPPSERRTDYLFGKSRWIKYYLYYGVLVDLH